MSNPFEAALSLLEGAAFAIRGHAKNREKALEDCQEIANACIVLRAAGKMDKEAALSLWDGSEKFHTRQPNASDSPVHIIDHDTEASIRALLSALPGGSK